LDRACARHVDSGRRGVKITPLLPPRLADFEDEDIV
jgi:hypothetical protein